MNEHIEKIYREAQRQKREFLASKGIYPLGYHAYMLERLEEAGIKYPESEKVVRSIKRPCDCMGEAYSDYPIHANTCNLFGPWHYQLWQWIKNILTLDSEKV